MLHAGWNGAAHTRAHNARKRADWRKQTARGRVQKGLGAGHEIRLVSLEIWLGQASGLEASLRALKQGNVDVMVLQ